MNNRLEPTNWIRGVVYVKLELDLLHELTTKLRLCGFQFAHLFAKLH